MAAAATLARGARAAAHSLAAPDHRPPMIRRARPILLVLGPAASGKSTLGHALAARGFHHVELDPWPERARPEPVADAMRAGLDALAERTRVGPLVLAIESLEGHRASRGTVITFNAVATLPPRHAAAVERAGMDLVVLYASGAELLDGYLARRWQQTSAFGAFLDPVADKLMVAAALIVLVQLGRLDAILATIIIGREITISALREWMAQIGAHRSVAVSMIGKIKTSAQMIAIPLLLYQAPVSGFDVFRAGTWLIYVAAVLTLWSMGYYMRMAWPHLMEAERRR